MTFARKIMAYKYELLLAFICFVFTLLKAPTLSLPLFWDEILYGCAIQSLLEAPLSFSPASIPVELSRGHPIFYHFLNALFYKLTFGENIQSLKKISLLVATISGISLYYISHKLGYSKKESLLASSLLFLQNLFFVQSTVLLPEILLMLLSVWTFYFFISQKHLLLFIFTTCILFTKETGIVLWVAMILTSFIHKSHRDLKTIIAIIAPLTLLILYFYWQYIVHGWVFFPYHTHLLNFNTDYIFKVLKSVLNVLFIKQARFLYFLPLPYLVYKYFKKNSDYTLLKKPLLHLAILFFTGFILFSSFNFFTDRYLLSILPLVIIAAITIFQKLYKRHKEIALIFMYCCVLIQVKRTMYNTQVSDVNLGYADAIYVAQKPIDYLKSIHHISAKTICTHFLMRQMLSMPCAGYLKTEEVIRNIEKDPTKPHDYLLISSYDFNNELSIVKDNPNYILLKEFKKNKAWSAIYAKK